MKEVVRIKSITIENVKNVTNGNIVFENGDNSESSKSDVIGVYGQNGSGKTALVDAMRILKKALSYEPIPNECANLIQAGKDYLSINASFYIFFNDKKYTLDYCFQLNKIKIEDNLYKVFISDEVLKLKDENDSNSNKITLYNTTVNEPKNDYAFSPTSRFLDVTSKNTDIIKKLYDLRIVSRERNRSFIFNADFINILNSSNESKEYISILNLMIKFGRMDFFVINQDDSNNILITMNYQIKKNDMVTSSHGLLIPVNSNTVTFSKNNYDDFLKTLKSINLLLKELIPGMEIGTKNERYVSSDMGEPNVICEIVSKKDGYDIPLRHESNGIRKIISILNCLMCAHNKESFLVVIDEFDSGVFEFLLGELSSILKESGLGQVVFTSHNLRALEVLGKNNIYFTTTDPNDVFQKFQYLKQDNNLRNVYLRTIFLDSSNGKFYKPTETYKIRAAFLNTEE